MKEIHVSAGLDFLKERIIMFGVQSPPSHRSDLDLVVYLQNEMVGLNRLRQ